MEEDYIPRRLLRFYRKKPTESEVKEKSTEIAVKEVDKFVNENKRYPSKEEIDKIAESVFEQLKKELNEEQEKRFEDDIDLEFLKNERQQARRRPSRREKSKVENKSQEKIEEQPEEEQTAAIVLPEKEEEEEIGYSENIEKIAGIEEVASLEDDLSIEDDFDNVEKEMEEKHGVCPRCKSKTDEIIFCPNCGEAFCNHCAKAIETLPEGIKYTCPNCQAMFKKRKTR